MKKILAVAVLASALAACNSSTPAPTPKATPAMNSMAAANTPAMAAAAAGPKSPLTATVSFTGTAPVAKKLGMEADAYCAKHPANDETVMVKDGKLANVVVRVIKGADGHFDAPATPVVVQQDGCMYRPRVTTAVTGQSITVKSADDTGHNVHPYKGDESLFNKAQAKGQEFTKTTADYKQDNGPITFKCDIHPWMTGYIVVNPNPYSAVTDAMGVAKFDLPAGKYTIQAWHEKFGTKTQDITVEAGKPVDLKFDFAATDKPSTGG